MQFIFINLEIFIIGKQTELSLSRGLESVCVCACVRACVRAYMRACVCACGCVCVIHIVVMMQRIVSDN